MNKSRGQYIKRMRKAAKKSQWQITKALGYAAVQYASDWDCGRSNVPLDKIKPLAKLLNINPKELLFKCYPEIKAILEK